MKTELLKDLLFEKVENSISLKNDIKDCLLTEIELVHTISSQEYHASGDTAHGIAIENTGIVVDELIKIITDFVNQNYTPKTNKI